MPADPIHPDQPASEQRFHAYLLAYLDSLPIRGLADLLGELPSSRQEPPQLGVLMVALNERLTDTYKLLPPTGQPDPHEERRWSLREVVADRRAARAARRAGPPGATLEDWLRIRPHGRVSYTTGQGAESRIGSVAQAGRKVPIWLLAGI